MREVPCVNIEPFGDLQSPKMSEISIFSEIFWLGKVTRKFKIFSDTTIPQNGSDVTYLTCSKTVTLFSRTICPGNTPDLSKYRENRCLGRTYNFPRHIQSHIQPTNLRIVSIMKNPWKKSFLMNLIKNPPYFDRFDGVGTIFRPFRPFYGVESMSISPPYP